jgi:hypothetical protein
VSEPLIISLIGASATIVAALLGLVSSISKDRATPSDGGPRPKFSFRKYRREYISVGIALVLASVVLWVGYSYGKTSTVKASEANREGEILGQTASYMKLVGDGYGKKPYVFPSVVMLVTLEKSGKSIWCDRHIVYQLHALTDISVTQRRDKLVFKEGYSSNFRVDRIPGTEHEEPLNSLENSKSWGVFFEAKKGERHSVVTAVHVSLPVQFKGQHKGRLFNNLAKNEDEFTYTNDQNDVIEELVIIVQSNTLKLKSLDEEGAAVKVSGLGSPVLQNDTVSTSDDGDGLRYSAVARFRNLGNNDIAGIRAAWTPLSSVAKRAEQMSPENHGHTVDN